MDWPTVQDGPHPRLLTDGIGYGAPWNPAKEQVLNNGLMDGIPCVFNTWSQPAALHCLRTVIFKCSLVLGELSSPVLFSSVCRHLRPFDLPYAQSNIRRNTRNNVC